MRRQALFLVVTGAMLGGCATAIHGPYQDVRLESDPPGATATVSPILSERGPRFLDPKKQTVITPATVRLRRDNTYRVELSKPGYQIGSTRVVSQYDWLWAPVMCGPCEAAGQLPTYDLKDRPLPLRFAEAAFYEYPRGFFRSFGYAVRIFSPEALLGTAFKLRPEDAGFFGPSWHGLGEPAVSAKLEPKS
jgi:hypothetical protein